MDGVKNLNSLKDSVVRFKSYKVGKVWLYSAIVTATLGISAGISSLNNNVHADTVDNGITAVKEEKTPTVADAVTKTDATNKVVKSQDSNAGVATDQVSAKSSNVEVQNSTAPSAKVEQQPAATPKASDTVDAAKVTTAAPATIPSVNAKAVPVANKSVKAIAVPTAKANTAKTLSTSANLTTNIDTNTTVSASELANAKGQGPFTAGVNQVIPFEAFGGDGMLTRLILNGADKAPWSDNGTAKNDALLPVKGLAKGQYFYEVDFKGNLAGKQGQALIDQLRLNGTKSYGATVKIYPVGSNGMADLSKIIASKDLNIKVNGLTSNVKDSVSVPARYLANAKGQGPFTAGVNQVIPFEAFGGDGMLTRLLLNSSDKAPWSDNGTAKNAALLPIQGLAKGEYFYEVDLNGNVAGKQGQALIDQLRSNGTKTYTATVKIYAAGADGKADTSKVVATKNNVEIKVNGLASNIKDTTSVPASYLANAKGKGPFTAGVNQVIPYEAFGGDGMLTRLLLNGADKAPWSNNGVAMNKALLPIEGLAKGEYFYEVDLNGNLAGKQGQALIDQLRSNGTKTYSATVKIYAAGADGKADTSKVVATKNIMFTINVNSKMVNGMTSQNKGSNGTKTTNSNTVKMNHSSAHPMGDKVKSTGNTVVVEPTSLENKDQFVAPVNVSDKMTINKNEMGTTAKEQGNMMSTTGNSDISKGRLPQTGENKNNPLVAVGLALLAGLVSIGGFFGLRKRG